MATPIYPPGYYAILRAFLAIFGRSPSVLRWVTAGAIATICAAVSLASGRARRDAWLLFAPAIFLGFFSSVIYSGAPTKPEFLATAFAMVGLALYMRLGFDARSRWWLPCCACAFAAALLVKYTVIGTFVAVTAHLLLRRQYRQCASFLGISLGIVAAIYGTMHILTHGGVYLFTVRANAVSPQLLKVISLGVLGVLPKAFVVFAVGAAYTLMLRAEDRGAPAVAVALAIFVSLPLAVLAIGKPGSSPFYFLEPVVLGALAITLLVRRSYEEANREAASLFPVAALLAMGVIQLPSNLALVARREGSPPESAEVRAHVAALRPAADEFVMADAYYVFDVAQAGFTPVMIDNLVFTLLVDNRVIDDRRLLALFESGKVPYLVLQNTLEWHASLAYGGRFYPPAVVDYLRRNYVCETLMKRWDDAALVICRRSSTRSGEGPAR
ncbi:MAG: hypothetical protein M3068_06560 [Gemmatimonadota bacterium]|nr:hypothetical protein [Gemmatimonadota bacterium]